MVKVARGMGSKTTPDAVELRRYLGMIAAEEAASKGFGTRIVTEDYFGDVTH